MGKPAARLTDSVSHATPPILTGGPGSLNVLIGNLPAWRGVPKAAASSLKSTKKGFDTAIKVAENVAKATPPPGKAAAEAAAEATKATAAATMSSLIASTSMGADIHVCAVLLPVPPHGPGVVIDGSSSVLINGLPACFQGNSILEAVGPMNKITKGCTSVQIGK